MLIRIRFGDGRRVARKRRKNRVLALAVAALLMPAALMAALLAVWRLASDLSWTGEFAIARGPFSHWQIWMLCAVLLLFGARQLNRYGVGAEPVA